MLFSASTRIAFAHYPKTAGTSLTNWFLRAFPDARPACSGFPHTSVTRGLELLGERSEPTSPRPWFLKLSRHSVVTATGSVGTPIRIIGVVREPFEMLVSLYEYWRRNTVPSRSSFIRAAQRQSFSEFLRVGFRRNNIVSYERFFDVGGPTWPTTRLVAFESLQDGLDEVCREFGIAHRPHLERLNGSPRYQRTMDDYVTEAGPLYGRVRAHFAWYYGQGRHLAIHGPGHTHSHERLAA